MKICKPLVIAALLGSTLLSAVAVEAKPGKGNGHAYGHNKNWKNNDDDDRRAPRRTRRHYRNRGTQSTRIHSKVINGETRYYRIVDGRRVYLRRSGSGNNNYSTPIRSTLVNGVTRYYRVIDGRRVYYRRDSYINNGVVSYRYTRI
ncbi:MAG TPA: hypothetical protein VF681_09320 [Abditibacteriaceae bacterium]|jgi:hypothetical protein